MNQILNPMEIGSQVEVELSLVRDRISENLLQLLSENPVGTVIDYKMTDGSGIGVVLQLGDGSFVWFFSNELRSTGSGQTSFTLNDTPYQEKDLSPIENYRFEADIHKVKRFDPRNLETKRIIDLVNPIVFFRWLIYSLKDVY